MLFGPKQRVHSVTVTDPKLRKALTMYRLSEHILAIEKCRHGSQEKTGYVYTAHNMSGS